ncbi:MAG: hypothetical protein GQ525_11205 [Draconibacterium sp.]|nr:hypothetical protein [Draconibacterium sp.]
MNLNNKWQHLSIPYNETLNNVLRQQHHAAQFIALVGRYIIPQKPDVSNINMQYHIEKEILLGNQLPNGLYIGVQIIDLKIQILNAELEIVKELSLSGKTFNEAFQEFKLILKNLGVDVSELITKQPFELSADSLKEDKYFSADNIKENKENQFYRYNAEMVIGEIGSYFNDAAPVRIWPHHFDTGTILPVSYNEKGEVSQSIGLGWAIPDSMVAEPYFYLSFWSEKPLGIIKGLTPLNAGKWMMPDWNGAVLKLSEILKQKLAQEQHEMVKSFFTQGIEIVKRHLKK